MCVFFSFKITYKVQGRCAQVDRVSYTILQNVAIVHFFTRSRGLKRGIKCYFV